MEQKIHGNIEVTAYYGEVLDKNGIPNQNDLVEGYGHDNDFWVLGHYNFMQKIFKDSVMGDEGKNRQILG